VDAVKNPMDERVRPLLAKVRGLRAPVNPEDFVSVADLEEILRLTREDRWFTDKENAVRGRFEDLIEAIKTRG
jgi:hypothetical protein